ncbi:hypothetical protein PPN31119_03197 [Pandoraea pnomenusa]|uniref:Large polyvalent protein-associated domain-containing protein n=1 Tax=Pandoraea pnomenusa TaxID=93220 RepID=A0ABY6WM02_9BURK|nr:hypothetical protein [Pandoraea pnomenusa]VVE69173.1 hypothetical protein PPN31119_03197 [Pandoraea pnomenusa]
MPQALHIYFHVRDSSDWDESRHPRAKNGRFGSGGASSKVAMLGTKLRGDELGQYSTMKELREKALTYADRFIGKNFKNAHTGHEINVTRAGVRHTISGASDSLVRTVPAIPELLQRARLVETSNDKRGDPNILGIEKYAAPVTIDGKTYQALLTVKQYRDGRRYYDHGLVQ